MYVGLKIHKKYAKIQAKNRYKFVSNHHHAGLTDKTMAPSPNVTYAPTKYT